MILSLEMLKLLENHVKTHFWLSRNIFFKFFHIGNIFETFDQCILLPSLNVCCLMFNDTGIKFDYDIWYDLIKYNMTWYMISYHMIYVIWYDMIWYDMMIWYIIWYIWYDIIWFDLIMIWYMILTSIQPNTDSSLMSIWFILFLIKGVLYLLPQN